MWFTSEALEVLDIQQNYLKKKYEEYKSSWVFKEKEIVDIFSLDAPLLEDQNKIVRLNDDKIVVETVALYQKFDSIKEFEEKIENIIKSVA